MQVPYVFWKWRSLNEVSSLPRVSIMWGVALSAFSYQELRFTLMGTGTITFCTKWAPASAGLMKAYVGDRMCLKQLKNNAVSVHRTGHLDFPTPPHEDQHTNPSTEWENTANFRLRRKEEMTPKDLRRRKRFQLNERVVQGPARCHTN